MVSAVARELEVSLLKIDLDEYHGCGYQEDDSDDEFHPYANHDKMREFEKGKNKIQGFFFQISIETEDYR